VPEDTLVILVLAAVALAAHLVRRALARGAGPPDAATGEDGQPAPEWTAPAGTDPRPDGGDDGPSVGGPVRIVPVHVIVSGVPRPQPRVATPVPARVAGRVSQAHPAEDEPVRLRLLRDAAAVLFVGALVALIGSAIPQLPQGDVLSSTLDPSGRAVLTAPPVSAVGSPDTTATAGTGVAPTDALSPSQVPGPTPSPAPSVPSAAPSAIVTAPATAAPVAATPAASMSPTPTPGPTPTAEPTPTATPGPTPGPTPVPTDPPADP
jgi:hypothetical protein